MPNLQNAYNCESQKKACKCFVFQKTKAKKSIFCILMFVTKEQLFNFSYKLFESFDFSSLRFGFAVTWPQCNAKINETNTDNRIVQRQRKQPSKVRANIRYCSKA